MPASNFKLFHLTFHLYHYLANVILEFSVIKMTNFFIDFIFYCMQIYRLCLFLQIFFIGCQHLLIEIWRNCDLIEFSCPKFELSFDLFWLFLVLSYLLFKTIDSLSISLNVKTLKVFYSLHILQSLKLIFRNIC